MSNYIYGTRVTYTDSGIPNVKVTRETFMKDTSEGIKHYKCYINEVDKRFFIRDEKTSDLVVEGNASSLHKLKIKVKESLTKLGIQFNNEKRKLKKEVDD
jgi:hypothetical protein